jgi:hypothetical protein
LALTIAPVLAYPDFSQTFYVTTDASKTAVAGILSQYEGGIERPIAYASRQLNQHEQKYSYTEPECLALIWALRHFRTYLYGRRFVARTDHRALAYLKKFSNHARLMRWSLKLAEFEFDIEYTAGKTIQHADALSRHIAAVSADPLSRENIKQKQLEDTFCQKIQRNGFFQGQYYLDKGLMYTYKRAGNFREDQLVIPHSLVNGVIKVHRNSPFASHPGQQRTFRRLSLHYWWSQMRAAIQT